MRGKKEVLAMLEEKGITVEHLKDAYKTVTDKATDEFKKNCVQKTESHLSLWVDMGVSSKYGVITKVYWLDFGGAKAIYDTSPDKREWKNNHAKVFDLRVKNSFFRAKRAKDVIYAESEDDEDYKNFIEKGVITENILKEAYKDIKKHKDVEFKTFNNLLDEIIEVFSW